MSIMRWSMKFPGRSLAGLALLAGLVLAAAPVRAPGQSQSQQPAAQPQQPDQSSPAAGGPKADSGVIVVPKKTRQSRQHAPAGSRSAKVQEP